MKHKERNHAQYIVSLSVSVFLLIMEVVLIIIATPSSREIYVASNQIRQLSFETPIERLRVIKLFCRCFANQKIGNVNLQSEEAWSICLTEEFIHPISESKVDERL